MEGLRLGETDGERLGLILTLGDSLGLKLGDRDGLILGLIETDGDTEGLAELPPPAV